MKTRKQLAITVGILVMLAIVLGTLMPLVVFAEVPQRINYQGYLTDSGGNPIDRTVSIVFSIYDVATGGTALWSETQNSVVVSGGLFSVQLGSVNPLPSFSGSPRYLGIKVGADPEMTPRQLLASAPYALNAATATNADTVDGQHASAFASTAHHHDLQYVNVTGDTMTGTLNLPANSLMVGTNQLVLASNSVCIGTTKPIGKLTVAGSSIYAQNGIVAAGGSSFSGGATFTGGVGVYNSGGVGLEGNSEISIGMKGSGQTYDFYAGGPGTNYGPFTGAHEVKLGAAFPQEVSPGMIVSVTGETQVRTDEEHITFSSTLLTVELAAKPNDVAVLGVIIAESPLPEDHWYKSGDGERFGIVNALGEGRVWVTNLNGDIQAGDYTTTSALAGYGQKQADDLLHSYTLGKATESVDWSKVTDTVTFNGQTLKAYPIAVVYTSG